MHIHRLFQRLTPKLTQKILFVTIPVILASMLLLMFVSTASFQGIFEKKISELAYNELLQNTDQIENMYVDMIKLGNVIDEDEIITSALEKSSLGAFDEHYRLKTFSEYTNIDYQRMSQIETRLSSLKNTFFFNREADVVLFSVDGISGGTLFDARNNRELMLALGNDLKNQPWISDLALSPGGFLFLPRVQYPKDQQQRTFLTAIKTLYNHYNNQMVGLAIIHLDTSNLDALNESSADRNFYLFTADGQTVYTSEHTPMDFLPPRDLEQGNHYTVFQDGQNKFIVNHDSLRQYELELYSAIDYSSVYSEVHGIRVITFVWTLLLTGLVVVLIYAYLSRLTRPLTHLIQKLQARKIGSYSLTAPHPEHPGDIENIVQGFELLFCQIEALTQKVLDNQRREYELKYEMLKAQINPHFMFNTLNVIKWSALMGHNEKVADMIADLGLLLEASINRDVEEIPISQELHLIRSYMNIQNARFDNRFALTVRQDPALDNCRIIKLILQPIVENSIIHGFCQVNAGHIQIDVAACQEDILITVSDDGAGIEPDKLEKLLAPGTSQKEGFSGIGTRNIHERLQMKYGEPYGLSIQSDSEGTTVILRIPKLEVARIC